MSEQHHAPNVKLYLTVFAVLMVLTVVTVLVSYLHLPTIIGIALGLMIATVKASFVAAYFMHLKGERVLIYGLLGVTLFFFVLLYALPISDAMLTAGVRLHVEAAPVSAEH